MPDVSDGRSLRSEDVDVTHAVMPTEIATPSPVAAHPAGLIREAGNGNRQGNAHW
jgi:hypothetical protein